jgi:hypothetical protein
LIIREIRPFGLSRAVSGKRRGGFHPALINSDL